MKPNNFKICVRTLAGAILTFSVDNYAIIDGSFVSFLDNKTGNIERFHSSNCEIRDIREG